MAYLQWRTSEQRYAVSRCVAGLCKFEYALKSAPSLIPLQQIHAVGKIISDNQITNGGPIIMLQIENEYYNGGESFCLRVEQ